MIISLITLLFILFFGGPEEVFMAPDVVKRVKKVVEDKERKKEVLSLLKDGKKEIKAFNKNHEKNIKSAQKTLAKKTVTSNQIKEIMDAGFDQRVALQGKIIEKRLKLQSLIKSDEWDEIIKPAAFPSDKYLKKENKTDAKEDKEIVKILSRIKEAIESSMEEGEKKQVVKVSFSEFEEDFKEYIDANQKLSFASSEILRNHQASEKDLMKFYEDQNKFRREVYASFNTLFVTTRAQTTDEEWNTIRKAILKIFK